MLTGVLVVLLVLIALLAVPVTLTHHITWQQGFLGEFALGWLFGLVRIRFSPFKNKTEEKEQEPSTSKEPSARKEPLAHKKPSQSKSRNAFATIWQEAFRQRITKFICDLWHAVHKENIKLRLCLGLGDPADTGLLWAIMGPVAGILASAKEATIEIVPDFLETNVEVDSSGTVRLIPLQIIGLTLGLMLSPTVLKGIMQMRAA